MRRGPVSAEDSTSPRPSREPGHGPIGKAARRFFFGGPLVKITDF